MLSEQYPKKKQQQQRRSDLTDIHQKQLFQKKNKTSLVSCYTVLFSVFQRPAFFAVLYLSRSLHSDSRSTHYENAEDFCLHLLLSSYEAP